MSDKIEYEITEEGHLNGVYYKKGDRAYFHPRQVRHQAHRMVPVSAIKTKPVKVDKKPKD